MNDVQRKVAKSLASLLVEKAALLEALKKSTQINDLDNLKMSHSYVVQVSKSKPLIDAIDLVGDREPTDTEMFETLREILDSLKNTE